MALKGTEYAGVRYREHASRRHNGRPDKYFFLRYYIQGVRHEEGLGFAADGWTAKKAAAILADLRKAHATGAGPQTLGEMRAEAQAKREAKQEEKERVERMQGMQALTLGEFLLKYELPRLEKETRGWKKDESRIRHRIIPALGHLPLPALTQEDITDFLDDLHEAGLAQATVNHHFTILRQAYKNAGKIIIDGCPLFAGRSPLEGMTTPDPFNARVNFFSYEQADQLIELAKRRDMDLHDAIVLALNAGLRLGEVQRMEWPHVDLEHGFIAIPSDAHRKTGGMVKVTPEMMCVLECRKACREQGEKLVFASLLKGKQRETFSHGFKALVDELGFNEGITDRRFRFVFHTLRHTFASWLALAGTDIYRIKHLMRHKTLAMTERYAHLIPDATVTAVMHLRPPKAS